MRIGFNLGTATILLSIVLTLITEFLYLEYFKEGVEYVVATCYLGWAMISWYFFFRMNARSRLSNGE